MVWSCLAPRDKPIRSLRGATLLLGFWLGGGRTHQLWPRKREGGATRAIASSGSTALTTPGGTGIMDVLCSYRAPGTALCGGRQSCLGHGDLHLRRQDVIHREPRCADLGCERCSEILCQGLQQRLPDSFEV